VRSRTLVGATTSPAAARCGPWPEQLNSNHPSTTFG
jgi:hypothetical protein